MRFVSFHQILYKNIAMRKIFATLKKYVINITLQLIQNNTLK